MLLGSRHSRTVASLLTILVLSAPIRSQQDSDTTGWKITDSKLSPIEGNFRMPFGLDDLVISPTKGQRLVKIQCKLTASLEDPKALEKLAKTRKAGELSAEEKKALNGKYRFFDMNEFKLTDSKGNHFDAVWIVRPLAVLNVTKEGKAMGSKADPEFWHSTEQSHGIPGATGRFVGLLDIGRETTIVAVFSVADSAKLSDLGLGIAKGKPTPVEVAK